jgi:hypothetical protein
MKPSSASESPEPYLVIACSLPHKFADLHSVLTACDLHLEYIIAPHQTPVRLIHNPKKSPNAQKDPLYNDSETSC